MPLEIPPTLPPGVTVQNRANKFTNWNGPYAYYERAETRLNPWKTDKMTTMVYNMDHMRASQGICKSMRIANKSQVVRGRAIVAEEARPGDLCQTIASATHSNFSVQNRDAQANISNSGEEFKLKFYAIFATLSDGGDDAYIRMHDVPIVVKSGLGDTVPKFIMDKFMVLSKKAEVGGRVYWADFSRLVPEALSTASADCSLKRELPPLVMLMTKPRIKDPDMGPVPTQQSSYVDTFCVDHKKMLTAATEKPKPHSILNPASKDLARGSVKGTYQIPGYSGHMPLNINNPRKHAHSGGEHMKPVVNSLRMTKKGGNNVLGYSGHLPWHASSDGERLGGEDPRTSTGAAFGPTRLML
jgi:hypothetical protein